MKNIGKYRIIGILGKGAMGIVYKARDPDIDRDVAIKTIRFDLVSHEVEKEEMVERFMREARSAGRLSHSNIITIYDVGRKGDLTYIVMQYIEGESLQKMIASKKKFSPLEVIELMTPLCDALDYAHQRGIVHRDIKPANILMDKKGMPYLVDFGVAHIETSTITQAGTTLGTPSYMSPEQVMGKKIDRRSDIFSLGVILYELLTRQRPFGGENISTIIYKIVNEEPSSITEVNRNLPEEFERVIKKALAKNPEDRYKNCKQFVGDLLRISQLSEETLTLEMGDEEFADLKMRRKSKLSLIIAFTVGAIIILGGGGALYLSQKSKRISVPSSEKKEAQTELPKSAAQPEAIIPDQAQVKLDKVKKSFESESFEETIRLAEEILTEDAENATARDYLNRAKDKNNEMKIAQILQDGINSYKKGDYRQCILEMQKILESDQEHKEAKRYLYLAEMSISRKVIEQILESQRKAEEEKDLLSLLSHIGSQSLFDKRKEEATQLFNSFDDIDSLISEISVNFKDSRHATVSFSHLLTGLDKQTGQKKVVFEEVKTWTVEKQGKVWKIIE